MTMATTSSPEVELQLVETPVGSVSEVVTHLRDVFKTRRTFPLEYRVEQLRNLKRMVNENLPKLFEALWIDLRKAKQEAFMTELNLVTTDIDHAISNLPTWIAAEHVQKNLIHKFNSAYIQSEPYGVVLIISPWNFPLMLSLQPLVGAIAAGNSALLKLSEFAVATSNCLAELIPSYLDKECFSVVTGGLDVAKEVTSQRFDYIFFTGSTRVGKSVMTAAAQNLTPLTLELGGKSPCIVADDADLEVTAKRIMWGKCMNSGQSCVAPDYILCSPATQDTLAQYCQSSIKAFFGEDPKKSPDYGRLINTQSFQRIKSALESVRNNVFCGGECDAQERYIAPTVLKNITGEDDIMAEEIFGPLLPIVPVDNVQKAIEFVNAREKALAVYVFTSSSDTVQAVTGQVSCGGITHNDTMLHYSVPTLPFGGVGHSGFGSYHGKFSFDTFSHRKAVLSTSTKATIEGVNNIRYPPYADDKIADVQRLQTEGGVSRVFQLASLLTRSAVGRARYRHSVPNTAVGERQLGEANTRQVEQGAEQESNVEQNNEK